MTEKRNILITGPSMGIGKALALEFADPQHHLILVSRNVDKLKELQKILSEKSCSSTIVPCDLIQAQERKKLVSQVQETFQDLHVLINNAGMGIYGSFQLLKEKDIRKVFELNFFAVVDLVQSFFPMMKGRDKANIINISSIAGFRGVPNMSIYCASKFALNGFTESLRLEYQDEGIKILNVYPGPTHSEFFANSITENWSPPEAGRKFSDSAEKVAKKTYRAYQKGKRDELINMTNFSLNEINHFFPQLTDYIVKKIT